MFVLGITGGIGCGKSTFAKFFLEKGVLVIDADQISHQVTAKDGSALAELATFLPSNCFLSDGALDRQQVANLVFQEKQLLDQVSFVVHEHVIKEINEQVSAAKAAKKQLIVLDVPIPVKRGFLDICDLVVLVWAKEKVRLERLVKRGLSQSQAKLRMASQMTHDEYLKLAQLEIDNSTDLLQLEQAFKELVEKELNSRGIFI